MAGRTPRRRELRRTRQGSGRRARRPALAPGQRHRRPTTGRRRWDPSRTRTRFRRPRPERLSSRSRSRAQRQRRRLEIVDSELAGIRPPGRLSDRSHGLQRRPSSASVRCTPSRSASRYTSAVDSSNGSGTTTNACGASGCAGSTDSPAPVPSDSPGTSWLGTSAPSSAATTAITSSATGCDRLRQPQRRRGVGRAAAHPGGDRDPLVDLDPHRRPVPAARAQPCQRSGDQVRALDAGADDLVGAGVVAEHRQLELVAQRHRLEHGHELVAAVGASRPEEQAQVDLPRRARPQRFTSSASRRARGTRRATAARRARRRGWPSLDQRRPRALADSGRGARASASDPASALRRWANASWTSARTRRVGPPAVRGAGRPAPSRRSAPGGTRCARPAAAP